MVVRGKVDGCGESGVEVKDEDGDVEERETPTTVRPQLFVTAVYGSRTSPVVPSKWYGKLLRLCCHQDEGDCGESSEVAVGNSTGFNT